VRQQKARRIQTHLWSLLLQKSHQYRLSFENPFKSLQA
jgi:hypothetical protein